MRSGRKESSSSRSLGATAIYVTHDQSEAFGLADRVAVMYAGQSVETAPTSELLSAPFHPYTLGLKNAFPSLTGPIRELVSIPGAPPIVFTEQDKADLLAFLAQG